MQKLALVVSVLLHPLFVPAYCVLLLHRANPQLFTPPADFTFVLTNIVLYTLLFPLFTVFMLKKLGFIDGFNMKSRQNRILVLMPTLIFFATTYMGLKQNETHELLSDMLLGSSIALSVAIMINGLYHKISLHAIGMGGFFGIGMAMVAFSHYDISAWLAVIIVLAGLVGTCRLLLNAHTLQEVYNGYLTGFLAMAVALIV